MSPETLKSHILALVQVIEGHADELTALDQAVGDGDHGINMRRGFAAVGDKVDEIAAKPFGAALQALGLTLVSKIGGASGPLYGTLFMATGKASPAVPTSVADVAAVLAAGVEAVKQRGKSDVGAKTMLDVLVPVVQALQAAPADPLLAVRQAADDGLAATKPMRATKGRAAFLGERSVGHLDPGARSAQLLLRTLCDRIETTP